MMIEGFKMLQNIIYDRKFQFKILDKVIDDILSQMINESPEFIINFGNRAMYDVKNNYPLYINENKYFNNVSFYRRSLYDDKEDR